MIIDEGLMTVQGESTWSGTIDALLMPLDRSDQPGVVVGIAHVGHMYRFATGLASVESDVANTVHTRMRIGSTSKHFACLAAMLLAEEGKLDIDCGIRTYVPELSVLSQDPTLRQLMHHKGGLRCYLELSIMSNGDGILPPGEALHYQRRQKDVNFKPGDSMAYCNGGYHLLSLAIARTSGMSFEAFVQERIFDPLGMHDTESVPSDKTLQRGRATQHVPMPDGGYRRGVMVQDDLMGEGAIVSTVGDMLTWMKHLRGVKYVGSDATWKEMLTPAGFASGAAGTYAMGLMVERYRGATVIHHAGGVIGGSSQMITVPEHDLDIIILSNGAATHPAELALEIIDSLLGDKALQPRATPLQSRTSVIRPGFYCSEDSRNLVEFVESEGQIKARILNSPLMPVYEGPMWHDIVWPGYGPLAVRNSSDGVRSEQDEMLEFSDCGRVTRLDRVVFDKSDEFSAFDEFIARQTRFESHDMFASAHFERCAAGKPMLLVKGAYGAVRYTLEAVTTRLAKAHPFPGEIGSPGILVLEGDAGGQATASFRLGNHRARDALFLATYPPQL